MHCEHLQMLLQSSNQILTISLKFLANQTIELEVNTSEYEKKIENTKPSPSHLQRQTPSPSIPSLP